MGITEMAPQAGPTGVALHLVLPGPELRAAGASTLMREALSSVEGAYQADVLLDLGSVNRMSTGALAILLLLHERLAELGCTLSLIPPSGPARALISLYKLDARFGLT